MLFFLAILALSLPTPSRLSIYAQAPASGPQVAGMTRTEERRLSVLGFGPAGVTHREGALQCSRVWPLHCSPPWHQDLGTRILVPRSWYHDLGTQILVPGFWYQDPGTKILVPRSWYQHLGTKILVPTIFRILVLRLSLIHI